MKSLLRPALVALVGAALCVGAIFLPATLSAQELEVPAGCKLPTGSELLADFLASDVEPVALQAALARDNAEVEFLLATVPEPRLGFDGSVEAIAKAIETTGYTLDRYALPWIARPDKGPAHCQEFVPGAALFVRPPEMTKAGRGPRRLLIVYLIGESPTAGVHRLAFLRAAHEMATLRGQLPPGRCRSCDGVRLLGPSFSGAVTSLEQVLEHPAVRDLPFTIISGRATDASIRQMIEGHARPGRPVTFRATMIPDEALQREFFCYLTETLGADDHDIALLTESSTLFGQAAAAPDGSMSWREPLPAQKSVRCQHLHRPRLTLPVPLHISRLNAAWSARYMQSGAKPPAPPDPLTLDTARNRALPKVLDATDRTDVMPTLSPGTVVAADRALATILTTIAAERVRYVGLVFTDEQDTLFLTEQVRKFCPDVVLFTFDSNILYTHPDARPMLKGMLTVSTYPLFTRNQQWSSPFRGYTHRLQFSRDLDQGTYNAVNALLGRPDLMLEYSQPISTEEKPQDRPPIWVSAVGIEALIPLVFINNYDDRGFVFRNPQPPAARQFYAPYQQGTLSILILVLGIVGVILAVGYFRVYYASPTAELRYPWAFFRLFRRFTGLGAAPRIGPFESKRQPFFTLTIFLPMALLYPFFTTVHFMQLRDGNSAIESGMAVSELPTWLQLLHHSSHIGVYEGLTWRVLAIGLCAAACQLMFMITAADLLLSCAGRGGKLRSFIIALWQKRPHLITAAATALFLLGTFGVFRAYVQLINAVQTDFNNLVFMRRTAHPAFGLSPLYPMLILVSALQLWGYCNLQRIRLLEKLATVFIDFIEELEHETRLRPQLELLTQRLESPSLWQFSLAILAAIMLSLSLFSDVISLERYPLNFLFRLIFALLCVSVTYAASRFLRLWLQFNRFLELIAHHPLAHALERMPDALARSIGSLFLEELPEQARYEAEQSHARLLSNHLQQLQLDELLKSLSPADANALRPMFAELADLLVLRVRAGKTALSLSGLPEPSHTEIKEAHDGMQFDQVSRLIVRILKIFWRARPIAGALPDPSSVAVNQPTAAVYTRAIPSGLSLWLRLAEDLVAVQVVAYIHRVFPHLRNTLAFFTGALILMLLAIVTYPFQPQHFLGLVLWALVVGGVGLTVVVFVQMNRNETLSRIAKTEPGKVSFDRRFLSQVIIYGVLPLLSLLAAQFPEVRGVAFSWFETILKTLK